MNDFDLEIQQTFLEEATQILEDTERAFIALDLGDYSKELIDQIFRLAHNFKGSSMAVGFESLSHFSHQFENVLVKIKNKELIPDKSACTVLFSALDTFKNYIQGLKGNLQFTIDTSDLEKQFMNLIVQNNESSSNDIVESQVSIKNNKYSEEKSTHQTAQMNEDEAIRVSTKKLDSILNLVGELVVNQSIVDGHRFNGTIDSEQSLTTLSYLTKLVDEVQDITMSLRMVPTRPLFMKMRRTLRDVSNIQGKVIEMISEGEHVELDKAILDKISDPLTHLMRNAVDHGIETPEERIQAGKTEPARIQLKATQQEDHILISISDNGRGLDRNKLINKAIDRGIISKSAELTDHQAYDLIFSPGFSTKEEVTDISGRGVGMDVVMKVVEELKGQINIETKLGFGTTFIISLPLSLSIISGMVVRIDKRKYVIPVTHLVETIQYNKQTIFSSTGKGRMINLRGEVIPIVSLGQILHGKSSIMTETANQEDNKTQHYLPGLVTIYQGKKVSFEIDEIICQQQIVIKKIGNEMRGIPGILAGAILSSGEPSLILNLHDFIKRGDQYAINR